MQKVIFILIIISSILSSCSETRRAARTAGKAENEIINGNNLISVIRNNLSNNDFNIQKAEIDIIQENISARLIADIKFKKPDTLLITVRSRTGIEAGRAFITRDTLIIRDRINKKLMIGKPESLGAKYGIDPSLIFVILGDIVVEEKDQTNSMECVKGEYRKEFEINGKRIEYVIDCQRRKLKQTYFEGDVNSGNIRIGLSDIINSGKVIYPGRIEIQDDLKSVGIIMKIKKIESPWAGKIGSLTGQGYKVIKIR